MNWLPRDIPAPPEVMSLDDACEWQARFTQIVADHFADGPGLLAGGDFGIGAQGDRPAVTTRCEAALAEIFGGDACALVRGAGTGALRLALFAALPSGSKVLVHEPETYLTTKLTLEAMGAELIACDYNSLEDVERTLKRERVALALIQHMRPRVSDTYELASLIPVMRGTQGDLRILVDDNYAPLKAHRLGVACAADLSAFSLFKLGGPEGIGCVVGKQDLIDGIRPHMNSGGCIVQGPEAVGALEALARTALVTAYQSQVTRKLASRLQAGEVAGVVHATAAHTPETIVLVELAEPVADRVREVARQRGIVDRAVGMESRHEILPAFLRPSKSLMSDYPGIEQYVIRVSVMRAGVDQVISALAWSLEEARE